MPLNFKTPLIWFLCLLNFYAMAQEKRVKSGAYDTMLKTMLSHSVPEISVAEAERNFEGTVFLDAREKEEYRVSHLKGAHWVGYDDFEIQRLPALQKNTPIVVYCSVGKRSEEITEKLKAEGFTDVSNLYGGIFEWINQGKPVYNEHGETNKIHPYNFMWGLWLSEGEKEYDVD